MCRVLSGLVHKKHGITIDPFIPSHSDQIKMRGYRDDNPVEPDFVKIEIIPNEDWGKFWDAENWKFIIDQDIIPDWFDRGYYESEARKIVAKLLSECPETGDKETIIDGRYLAIKGEGVVSLSDYSVILFMPDETIIRSGGHSVIYNGGRCSVEYGCSMSVKYGCSMSVVNGNLMSVEYGDSMSAVNGNSMSVNGKPYKRNWINR